MDLAANEDMVISAGGTSIVFTGVYVIIPFRLHGEIYSRSGLASKGIVVAQGVGVIDSDFRGEIKVILYNRTNKDYSVEKGDRIAQIIFTPIVKIDPVIFDNFEEFQKESVTIRGMNGFGSTGVK